MKLVLLLLLISHEAVSFTFPNGMQVPGVPNVMNALPNGFPKGLFGGQPNAMMSIPAGFMNGGVQVVRKSENSSNVNNTCCFGATCLSPCPFGSGMPSMPVSIPMPILPPQPPIIVPAKTYYEPVAHNHPPLKKIKNIIRQDKKRRRKRKRYFDSTDTDTSDDTDYSSDFDSDSDSLQDSRVDYFDDVIHVNV